MKLFSLPTAVCLVLLGLPNCSSIAQTRTFDGDGDGTQWFDQLNWSSNNRPDTAGENAVIGDGAGQNYNVVLGTGFDEVGDVLVESGSSLRVERIQDFGDFTNNGTTTIASIPGFSGGIRAPNV